jgi:Uma2 family endonuclease
MRFHLSSCGISIPRSRQEPPTVCKRRAESNTPCFGSAVVGISCKIEVAGFDVLGWRWVISHPTSALRSRMATLEAVDTQIIFSPLLRQYSLEEFWDLPEPADGWHYDLIGGVLYMVPPPDPPHGDLDSRLTCSLVLYLANHGNPGHVYHPREAIFVDRTTLEPDMMFVSHQLAATMTKRRTSADIVFEYQSKSTAVYDRTTKADTYLALGVRELWLVDPASKKIEVRHSAAPTTIGGLPRWEAIVYSAGEEAESRVLAGWKVSVDRLFEGLE